MATEHKKQIEHLKLMLTPERKGWLRIRAATEGTTMSIEVGKAIDMYRDTIAVKQTKAAAK